METPFLIKLSNSSTLKRLWHKYFLVNFSKLLYSKQLLSSRLWHRSFPVNFAKFLRTPFVTEHPRWLPLLFSQSFNKTAYQHHQNGYYFYYFLSFGKSSLCSAICLQLNRIHQILKQQLQQTTWHWVSYSLWTNFFQ